MFQAGRMNHVTPHATNERRLLNWIYLENFGYFYAYNIYIVQLIVTYWMFESVELW